MLRPFDLNQRIDNDFDRILPARCQLKSEFGLSQREPVRDHLADPHLALTD
jgi:hypothetical protein